MPDLVAVDAAALDSLLFAFAGLGLLLITGTLLRIGVPLLRRFFLPAALIGGGIGLLLGPDLLALIPAELTTTWSGLAGALIAIVFAPMLMGQTIPSVRTAVAEAGPQIWMSYFSSLVQVAVPALLVVAVLTPVFGTDPLFSTIFEASWSGGHGTAAGMDEAWRAQGWPDGSSLALFSATIGLVFGVVMGTVLINVAARRGHLRSVDVHQGADSDILETTDATQTTTSRLNNASLSSLAFHFALIGCAILIGYVLKHVIDMVVVGVPLFPLAMVGGVVVQVLIRHTRLYELVDKATFNAIAAIALDFLVVAAIASLSVPVMMANWAPLVIVSVALAIVSVAMYRYLGPRIFKEDWAENAIAQFGAQTGVVAIGLMLLRTADPQMTSNAYRAFALRSPFVSPFIGGGLVTALIPILAVQYGNLWLGVGCLALAAAMLVLARLTGLWTPTDHPARSRS